MKRIRPHLTYANVMATLALFVALGGSSYAALQIRSSDVVNNSLRSKDIRNNELTGRDMKNGRLSGRDLRRASVGGRQVRESALGPVPNANRLGGATLGELEAALSGATHGEPRVHASRTGARAAVSFPAAHSTCVNAGRRLPTFLELDALRSSGRAVSAAVSGLPPSTATLMAPTAQEQLEVVILVPDSQGVGYRQAFTPDPLPFRCVALPSN